MKRRSIFTSTILTSVITLSLSTAPVYAAEANMESFMAIPSKNSLAAITATAYISETLGYAPGGTFGVWGWALVTTSWAEALIGLSYTPAPWLELGLGWGMEQNSYLQRLGANLTLQGENWYLMTNLENGESGWWAQVVGNYKIASINFVPHGTYIDNTIIGIGGLYKRQQGIGPRIEFGSSPYYRAAMKTWIAPLFWDPEATKQQFTLLAGITLNLSNTPPLPEPQKLDDKQPI